MKRALLLLAFACVASIGCQTHSQMANSDCQNCGPAGSGQYAGGSGGAGQHCLSQRGADYVPKIPHHHYRQVQPTGPAAPQYAYPYYTTRAPRDFLLDNPSTIGY